MADAKYKPRMKGIYDDTIVTCAFELVAGSIDLGAVDHDDTIASCWLSGGAPNETSVIRSKVHTAGGRDLVRHISIFVLP